LNIQLYTALFPCISQLKAKYNLHNRQRISIMFRHAPFNTTSFEFKKRESI